MIASQTKRRLDMVKREGVVTRAVIYKIHDLLGNTETGEEVLDFLRATEPLFMQEVGRFVQFEQDKILEDFSDDEDFVMYIGSVLGAAYVMGFLIAREQFHGMCNELVDIDSVVDEFERSETGNEIMEKYSEENQEQRDTNNEKGPAYHAFEENKLYNFIDGVQTQVNLKSGEKPIDIQGFFDEVTAWMEQHAEVIKEKYLPFTCLAVGLLPSQISAFLFGCFVGQDMEKKNISINTEQLKMDTTRKKGNMLER
jgi:hypothetical protein